jgi:hypothetical protein
MKKDQQVTSLQVHVIAVMPRALTAARPTESYAVTGFMDKDTAIRMFYATTQLDPKEVDLAVVTIDNVITPEHTPQPMYPGVPNPQLQQFSGLPQMPHASMYGFPPYNQSVMGQPNRTDGFFYPKAMRNSYASMFDSPDWASDVNQANNTGWIVRAPGKLELTGTKFQISYDKASETPFVATWDGDVFLDSSHSRLQSAVNRVWEHLRDLRAMGLER